MVLSVPLPEFADVRAGQARTIIASLLTRMPGGGWLSAAEADGLLRCYGLHARFAGRMSGVLVEPMITSGIETLAGVVQEPVFGPVVVFGLGGIATDMLADHAARLAPLTDADADDLTRSIRAARALVEHEIDIAAL